MNLVRQGLERENRGEIDPESGLLRQSIILRNAIARANKIIWQTAQSQPQCKGMGTTLVACLFYDDRVSLAHVGDSRAYRQRGDRLEQLTLDHSLLQELVDRGFYSAEEAQRSTNRNYVTRALGVESTVEVEIQEESVQPGDIYVLCSDGLTDMVRDEIIQEILGLQVELSEKVDRLIRRANSAGGHDNITAVLCEVL